MDSREISEWMAYYGWREKPPPVASAPPTAEEHAAALKAALFKGK